MGGLRPPPASLDYLIRTSTVRADEFPIWSHAVTVRRYAPFRSVEVSQ